MRSLIPIVVLLMTVFFVPRGAEEGQAEVGTAPNGFAENVMGAEGAANGEEDDDPDVIIETSGMLNRLELLNF